MPIETYYVEVNAVAVKVNIPEAVVIERDKKIAKHICLGCEREFDEAVRFRLGQCPSCYQTTRKELSSRRTTQSELLRRGKMSPKTKGGRKPSSPYTKELRGAN